MNMQPEDNFGEHNSRKWRQNTDLRNEINKYLFHWPFFLTAIILAALLAAVYVKFTGPVYEIKASILIKDDKKTPDEPAALHAIDLVNSSKIVENENEILSSEQIMRNVVQDLQLWIIYEQEDGLVKHELYKSGPVKLTFVKPGVELLHPEETLSFLPSSNQNQLTVTIKDRNSFIVLTPNGVERLQPFGKPFSTNLGILNIDTTNNLSQFFGSTIKIFLKNPDKVALEYQKLVDITLPDKLASVIDLSIDDQIPQRGKDILNDLILNYNLSNIAEKKRETNNTLGFIDLRLDSLTSQLTDVEKGIETFKSNRGLTDIKSESQMALQNLQANKTRLDEVNVQLSIIDGVERYINSSQNSEKSPATLGISDPGLGTLIDKLVQLQLQRQQLLATTPETNPDFEPINMQIATTKTAIKDYVQNIKSSLINARNKLQSFDSQFESSIKSIPTEERLYVSIKRQQNIKDSLYTYLLQQREAVSANYAPTLTDERTIDQAYKGPLKVSKLILPFVLALLLGIAIPALVIYKRVHGKVVDLAEIKEVLNIPIISELPFEISKKGIGLNNTSTTAIGEQLRALRTKLNFLLAENTNGKVILITSSVTEEGKSFIATNLALTLAASEKKILILDLDLRRPKIAKMFASKNDSPGVGDFLNGNATLSDIITHIDSSVKLDLILPGTISSNAAELLEQKQLKDLISSLRNLYDYIVIDSPPCHLVSDALIISPLSDLTLYVIRQGLTDNNELIFINNLCNEQQLSNPKIIFNGIRRVKFGYGYKYNKNYYSVETHKRFTPFFYNFSERF